MAKDHGRQQHHLRQLVAQQAARMMAEDGISDYAHAKRKAGRQLGVLEANCLPTNAEIEEEIKRFHEIYHSDSQPEALQQLRNDALIVMELLERFNPHLTGAVLDGTAGKHAETHIHLFADSLKDVEIFLLNQQIPYASDDKSYRTGGNDRKKVPVFTLEGPNGLIRLSIFEQDDIRLPGRAPTGTTQTKASLKTLKSMLQSLKTSQPTLSVNG
jgi:hypothetical protein